MKIHVLEMKLGHNSLNLMYCRRKCVVYSDPVGQMNFSSTIIPIFLSFFFLRIEEIW
jgi:hypothetical protein